ncbi:MAG TPA: acyl-CoA thioesterase [Anaerolineae bacterium]|nr:acyl-CoA thioesterase [Anaerolineae bacterium]
MPKPRTYTRRFRVRSTDCDALGHVNHAVYARYLQEAAIEASADAGYDTAWYDRHALSWLIRRSLIEYLQPARYGDELDIITYVANVRRVRSQRNYAIVRVRDGAPVAQAATDWAFIDQRAGAPARIPAEVGTTFLPDGPDPNAQPVIDPAHLPHASPPNAYHTTRRVHYYEMDENQHVNNAVYLNYLEQATIDAAASVGLDLPRLLELGGVFVVRRHDIEYLRPARYGDTLDIAAWIGGVGRSSVRRHYSMHLQNGELCIRAQTDWVWIDLRTKEASPVPSNVLDALDPGV